MSTRYWSLLVVSLSLFGQAFANDAALQMVRDEYQKTQNSTLQQLAQAKEKLEALESKKNLIKENSQKQADTELTWIEQLNKYDFLLTVRYIDAEGESQPNLELTAADRENINKLFDAFLQTKPLTGTTSVSQARKAIEKGIDELKRRVDIHQNPTEKNNSDLEILAAQTRSAEKQSKYLTEIAESLGLDPTTASRGRSPSSQK